MKAGKKSYSGYVAPFRQIAESSRMIHNTSLAVICLAAVASATIRGLYFSVNLPIALILPFILERVIVFCRGAGQKGSTGHSVLMGLLVFLLLPVDTGSYVLGFAIVLVMLLKHLQGGLGNYLCHPAVTAICILVVLEPGVREYYDFADVQVMRPVVLNYSFFNSGTKIDGLTGLASMLAENMPVMSDCLWGRVQGPLAESPLVFLIAGLYLIYRGYYNWRTPIVYLVSVVIAALVLPVSIGNEYHSVFKSELMPEVIITYVCYQLFSGYVIFCGSVVWLDFTSRPINISGQLLAGVIAGFGVIALRLYTTLQYSELLVFVTVGLLVPAIDALTRRPRAGRA